MTPERLLGGGIAVGALAAVAGPIEFLTTTGDESEASWSAAGAPVTDIDLTRAGGQRRPV